SLMISYAFICRLRSFPTRRSSDLASLLSTSALLGALLANGTEEIIQTAAAYGANVGMAFQLADDIIDVTSTSETSGKVRGTDLKERVPTLPILLLRQEAADGDQ